MRIEGKIVLVTGASGGLGAACAAEFARSGALLSLTARSEAGLAAAARPEDLVTPGDVTLEADRRRVFERTLERFGRVDILVNAAGRGLYRPSWQTPLADARALMDLNFCAALAMTQLVVPGMRERREGVIVNVGSVASRVNLPWLPLYSASKSALDSLTRSLRLELKRDGVHAMLACPVYVRTAFQQHAEGAPPAKIRSGMRFAVSAAECAAAIRRGVEREARTVMSPRSGWLLVAAMRLLPGLVESRLAEINGTA
jgi:short-subunit dehydrogenase